MHRWFLAAVAVVLSAAVHAGILVGKVVDVIDGDTITVLAAGNVQYKIRLAGIDAPEKKQPFGQRAKEQLSELVAGKAVEVETEKKDRYRRPVGKVIADGRDANLAMGGCPEFCV